MNSISKIIRDRFNEHKISYFANDNISDFITEEELAKLQIELKDKLEELLDVLLIDSHKTSLIQRYFIFLNRFDSSKLTLCRHRIV